MKDFGKIKYEKTFLSQVIIRVDFLQFLETEQLFCEEVEKVILKQHPRRGMDQKVRFNTINVLIDPDVADTPNAQKESLDGLKREYFCGKNKVVLSNKFLSYEINEYETFEQHFQVFQSILQALNMKQPMTSARIGIRYINLFEAGGLMLRKNMFSTNISATIDAKKSSTNTEAQLIRAMSMNEYQVSNMLLNFRFGMYNPDYPNFLSKDSFALDYDCFTTEPMDSMDDILRAITCGHDAIQELFEASITDSLRKVLRNE